MRASVAILGSRLLAAAMVVLAGACGAAVPTASGGPEVAALTAAPGTVTYMHVAPDDAFWVSRGADGDRAVSSGARLEVRPNGEVLRAAWDTDTASRAPLLGGLAIPARLGGGFLFWSKDRLFQATDFTGPLQPIASEAVADFGILGARAGLTSVFVLTTLGPREIDATTAPLRLGRPREPGLLDEAALDGQRAATLDVLGRARATSDGGRTWIDLTPRAGMTHQLVVGPADLWLDGVRGRQHIGADGELETLEGPDRVVPYDHVRGFQTMWKGRANADDPAVAAAAMSAAILGGAAIGDGTAFGVAGTTLSRVDLATGKLISSMDDWIPAGVTCQPVKAPDGVLFACGWDRSQGYGAYVLRSVDGGMPLLEKAFSDDGSFVADDEGALGFVGGCSSAPRLVDRSDPARAEVEQALQPILCVRSGVGRWQEHRIELGEGSAIAGWAPAIDGTAAAIVQSTDPWPPPVGTHRSVQQGGVTVFRVSAEVPGFSFRVTPSRAIPANGTVDRRFSIGANGSLDAWLLPTDSGAPLAVSATIDRAGSLTVHEAPAGVTEVYPGGAHAIAHGRDHQLYESADHGVTWHAAGLRPSPGQAAGATCSMLGCVLGPVARIGWGRAALEPRVFTELVEPREPLAVPRLVCTPRGAPIPTGAPAHTQAEGRTWWASLDIASGSATPLPVKRGRRGRHKHPTPQPSQVAPATPEPVVAQTLSLNLREPFAPHAGLRHFTGVDGRADNVARVVPLLTLSGDVDLLLDAEAGEVFLEGARQSFLPFEEGHETRDTSFAATGISRGGHALVLGAVRHALALEDRGGPPALPMFLGTDPEGFARPIALAVGKDGSLGVLVTDGGALGGAAIAKLDLARAGLGALAPLASWSTVRTSDDPSCKAPDPRAWRAMFVVEAPAWLTLDDRALPGMKLGSQALLMVRWGPDRVCLEGVDGSVSDERRSDEPNRGWVLAARWTGGRERGAAVRALDLQQEVICRVATETLVRTP